VLLNKVAGTRPKGHAAVRTQSHN